MWSRRSRHRSFPFALTLALVIAACDSWPTAPRPIDMTGVWTGALPVRLPEGEWSAARLSLVQSGDTITGELISPTPGVQYPLTGSVSGREVTLSVGNLPGTSTCAGVQLLLSDFDFIGPRIQRVSGYASGRCLGTIAGAFELRRAS